MRRGRNWSCPRRLNSTCGSRSMTASGRFRREHLLVSNSGPDGEGYHYCTGCGRIESAKEPEMNLFQAHPRPFLSDEDEPCSGFTASRIVLGTDFVTDISLFALRLEAPFSLRPGNAETNTALRTICEAVAKAACRMLEIESGEILAEYRPSFTLGGAAAPKSKCSSTTPFPAAPAFQRNSRRGPVRTENLIRVDDVMESPKLAE